MHFYHLAGVKFDICLSSAMDILIIYCFFIVAYEIAKSSNSGVGGKRNWGDPSGKPSSFLIRLLNLHGYCQEKK